ncbi:SDR family NAD(P)-dependent oxidoreductase [Ramlibacter sp. Leaf400]|uniref:SDR family NAD(P)-dependent oxidoreductase n=1 Tax=Ramlibacter sp. Leaf400 TaxID=1736365 RepID=UPI0006FE83C2|nr:SDR family NAD(P)-dependent oxidoreductase [Ramlibacter sp. Leaf400]KQT13188.1 3-oxoacyl-ACP reductase [Ramlibacter sp. Leaf400]
MNPQQQTVLITGAAGHLGQALAATYRGRGARRVLVDRHADALARAFGESADTLLLAADLLDAEQVHAAVLQAVDRFGRIDALCHLAGGFRMGEAVHETSPQTWDFLLDLNARTFLNIARALVPHMLERGGGRIVTVGAAAALKGAGQMGAYAASKSALIRLTEAMSAELRDRNINVNCVLPSIIDTPDNRAAMPDADTKRWVAPEALGEVIAFLASEAARAVHGAAVPVTGRV